MRVFTYREVGKRPPRLFFKSDNADSHAVRRAGYGTARWSSTTGSWSFPMDVTVLKSLVAEFPDADMSQELLDYLQRERKRQDNIAQAIDDTTQVFPDDPLWGFQRASVRFLDEVGRGVLGHDTGTGKTVMASSGVRYIGAQKIVLVCPDNVKWSWVDHLRQWADVEHPCVLEAGSVKVTTEAKVIKGSSADREDGLNCFIATEYSFVLILNYRQLAIHHKLLCSTDYDLLILDEAHRVKNRNAQQTKAAHKLAAKCARVWMLTATPIRNRETDVWSLLHMADPVRFSSYWNFVNTYFETVPGVFGGIEIVRLRDKDTFNGVLSQYMFSKSKEELLPDLPKKPPPTVQKLVLTRKQASMYTEMERDFVTYVQHQLDQGKLIEHVIRAPNTVAQITRLRQICLTPDLLAEDARTYDIKNSAKLMALRDLIEDLKASGEKFLVFTNFRRFLAFIEPILNTHKVKYSFVTGLQSSVERAQAEKDITEGKIDAILGTTKSMGEGMNLQAATVAIFCDVDWVPAVNKQAEDRIHRWGIKKPPTIIRLFHPGTVEQDILTACDRKEAIVDDTVGQIEVVRSMLRRRYRYE